MIAVDDYVVVLTAAKWDIPDSGMLTGSLTVEMNTWREGEVKQKVLCLGVLFVFVGFLATVCLVICAPGGKRASSDTSSEPYAEELQDADFEHWHEFENTVGWEIFPNCVAGFSPDLGRNGTGCAVLAAKPGLRQAGMSQIIRVPTDWRGKMVELSGWVRAEGDCMGYLTVVCPKTERHGPGGREWRGGERNLLLCSTPVQEGQSDWTRISIRFRVPDTVGLMVVFCSSRGKDGWVFFDDIALSIVP